ncbi:MAG: Tryptophan synthase alpha chain [Candidatus Bathyarchaeota archaeon BA1]|nr:MAG: Tryptophan synthase alpha chain [Candidatus Bathyarchaeota archaeon BA1]
MARKVDTNLLVEIFKVEKPIIGMVHLPPLPGSPNYGDRGIDQVLDFAVEEARALEDGGVDGLLVENLGDAPYLKTNVGSETISAMTLIARGVIEAIQIPIGVNILRNDVKAALAVAYITGGKFIRANVFTDTILTDQGIIEPSAPELLRYRRFLGAGGVRIFADVHVKHGVLLSPRAIEQSAVDAAYRGLADAIIVTGARTGIEPDLEDLKRVKGAVPDRPVLVGSGASKENIVKLLEYADGAIVGTHLKKDGITANRVDLGRVERFMGRVKEFREQKGCLRR